MAEFAAREILIGAPAGAALLAGLAERHGDAIAGAARLMTRLFELSSAWAPGLSFVGGQVDLGWKAAAGPAQSAHNVAGAGESPHRALASCLGEAVERLSQLERPGDIVTRSFREAAPLMMPAVRDMIERLPRSSGHGQGEAWEWVRGAGLANGDQVLVPADWCLRRPSQGPYAIPGAALSTGCAAGPDFEKAAERAVLELVERDAASLWWLGGQRAKPLAAGSAALRHATRLLEDIRQGCSERKSWLLDITTDLNIPCVAAVSVAEKGLGLACGIAARLSLAEAAQAAIFEMCQMELGLQVIAAKWREGGEGALNEADRRHLARASRIDAARCDLLHPLGAPRADNEATGSPVGGLAELRQAFARIGVEAAIVDLGRPDYGIAAVQACAPQLQLMPGGLRTERLTGAIETHGGGERSTGGVLLY